jgi:hypothetical protein
MNEEITMNATTSRTFARRLLGRRGALATGLGFALTLLVAMFGAGTASAEVAIHSYEASPSTSQAGGHPNLFLEFNIDNRYSPQLKDPEDPEKLLPCACNDAKDIIVNLPAGFIGNPHATPQCNAKEFAFNECTIDSQVGMSNPSGCLGAEICASNPEPIYNLIPPPGAAGLTGFKVPIFNDPLYTYLTARTGSDYGLRATVSGSERVFPIPSFVQELWGVPADPANDALRFKEPCVLTCEARPPTTGYASNSPLVPFLSNPTTCGESLSSSMEVVAYDHGVTRAESPWPTTTGCSQLAFNPSLSANPTTTEADTPSGLDVDLKVPQPLSPSTPSPSEIKATTVELPPGFTINPNAADGKTACLDSAAKFGTEEQAECPEFAKVASFEVHSAVLPGVLPGAVYLGEPQPGNRYRVFLVADGFGLHVKLPGSVITNPETGQLVVSFQNLPQTPFEEFNMHFFGSERGTLATPTRCGTYPVVTTFTPWDSALSEQRSTQFFTIDSGPNGTPCPGATRPFSPSFTASSAGNTAGAHTPFTVKLTRNDGDQNLTGLTVVTPPGFSGTLKGIPYCPQSALDQLANPLYTGLAEIASSACPAASQIGVATAGAGAGSRPLYTVGKVFLAGPYKGAPLSLEVVIPAVSGPYDVGNVAVRAAIKVDPITAQVTTVSDPLPQIIGGIPLRVRSIQVNLNRPDFALNPTNCEPLSTDATISGNEGAVKTTHVHYQVANCAVLPFAPKLRLALKGGTKRTDHPSLTANLTANPGDANIASTVVVLPHSEFLDNAHLQSPCTRVQFAAEACPAGSKIGFAKAVSPLIDQPLQGWAYLRSSSNKLPDIVIDLRGQINVVLDGRVDSVNERLRTTFESVPDVPVSTFTLSLFGGKKGLLVNSENLCEAPRFAMIKINGQNGKSTAKNTKLTTSCGAKEARHKRHVRRARTVR